MLVIDQYSISLDAAKKEGLKNIVDIKELRNDERSYTKLASGNTIVVFSTYYDQAPGADLESLVINRSTPVTRFLSNYKQLTNPTLYISNNKGVELGAWSLLTFKENAYTIEDWQNIMESLPRDEYYLTNVVYFNTRKYINFNYGDGEVTDKELKRAIEKIKY